MISLLKQPSPPPPSPPPVPVNYHIPYCPDYTHVIKLRNGQVVIGTSESEALDWCNGESVKYVHIPLNYFGVLKNPEVFLSSDHCPSHLEFEFDPFDRGSVSISEIVWYVTFEDYRY